MKASPVVLFLASCGLFPNVSDLGTPDASVTEGGASDVTYPTDAPADRAIDANADGGSSPCQGTFLFCADFDTVTNVSDGWSSMYSQGATAGGFDKTTFISAPASFVASMTGQADAGGATSWALDETLNMSIPSVLLLDFDVRLDVPSLSGLTQLDAVALNLGVYSNNDIQIVWQIEPNLTTQIYAQKSVGGVSGGGIGLGPFASLAIGTWKHVQFRVTQGSPPTLDILYDGVNVLTAGQLPNAAQDPVIDLAVGITYLDTASAPWKIEFDNVVVH